MRAAYRWYLRQLAAADAVVAISESTAADVSLALNVPESRMFVVYPVVRAAPAAKRDPAPEPTFLCVGGLELHKQPDLALRALAIFREQHGTGRLRIIGPASLEQRSRLLVQAKALGIATAVTIDGRVDDDVLDAAFASAWALLSTSRIEGFGLPPVEAVIRGTCDRGQHAGDPRVPRGRGCAHLVGPEEMAIAMEAPTPVVDLVAKALAERFSAGSAAASLWRAYESVLR